MSQKNTSRRLIYVVSTKHNTVIIDWNESMKLFLTGGEQRPFSPEKLLDMLHFRVERLRLFGVGQLLIKVGRARCVLTQQAVHVLADLYSLRNDLQVEYPQLEAIFAQVAEGSAR